MARRRQSGMGALFELNQHRLWVSKEVRTHDPTDPTKITHKNFAGAGRICDLGEEMTRQIQIVQCPRRKLHTGFDGDGSEYDLGDELDE
jgi:hypothetical protein